MFQNLIDIIAAPASTFNRLKEKPLILFPLMLLILSQMSSTLGYVLLTDFNFLIDQTIDQYVAAGAQIETDEVRERLSMQSPVLMAIPAMAIIPIFLLIINSLYAAYLNFVSKFGKHEYSFRHWFSVYCWISIPSIFSVIAAWAILLSSPNGQVPQTDLQVLSIDALLALNSDKTLLQYIGLPQLWVMGLLVYAYQFYTESSLLKSFIVSQAPALIIYGLWALVSFL